MIFLMVGVEDKSPTIFIFHTLSRVTIWNRTVLLSSFPHCPSLSPRAQISHGDNNGWEGRAATARHGCLQLHLVTRLVCTPSQGSRLWPFRHPVSLVATDARADGEVPVPVPFATVASGTLDHHMPLHPTALLLHTVSSPPGPAALVSHRACRLLLYLAAIHDCAPRPRQLGPYPYKHSAGCVFIGHCVHC
jgi:hypothetical protein